MINCSECGKEVDEKKAAKLTIDGKRHYLHLHHVRNVAQRSLSKVILNKTYACMQHVLQHSQLRKNVKCNIGL